MVIFVKKRPEITSKHLYFDRNPGKRLYSNLYLKNIDEFCLFCTLYLKKIDEVQVHGTFVLEMKIDLKYNLGYRMRVNFKKPALINRPKKPPKKPQTIVYLLCRFLEPRY